MGSLDLRFELKVKPVVGRIVARVAAERPAAGQTAERAAAVARPTTVFCEQK